MMNIRGLLIGAALCVVGISTPATASTTINFDGLASQVYVNNYYNGGTASDGSSGPNLGVQFVNVRARANIGSPRSTIGYTPDPVAYVNFASGFSTLDFDYGFLMPGTIFVYSGLNGTGTLLGQKHFDANITGWQQPFSPGSLAFSGTAKSFGFGNFFPTLAFDNIQFGSAVAEVPETTTWAMMLFGFGATAGALRRQRQSAKYLTKNQVEWHQ